MAKIEFVVPSVLNKGAGEKKILLEAVSLQDALSKVSDQMGEDFRRRMFDLHGKPRPLINIYVNDKNTRLGHWPMVTKYLFCRLLPEGRKFPVKICSVILGR